MQRVSNEYRASMKSPLRERAYIMVSFGLVNQTAQANAQVRPSDYAYFSNSEIFRDYKEEPIYGTFEENLTKVDGSMCFLPREGMGVYYDNGLISKDIIVDRECVIEISLRSITTNVKGLSILFGDNYPVSFDVIANTGQKIEVRNNTKSEWTTEEVLRNINAVKIIIKSMRLPKSRVRIFAIKFGYGLVYDNDSVLSSTLNSYVSPIGADLPQIDFSVQIKNYDHYFNVDNPNSAVNFFETGQEMNVMYGYELPDSKTIEWIQGTRLLCSGWESDDSTATIRCQDVLRNISSEYHKGKYSDNGRDFYSLIQEVLTDAGITQYYIEPLLKKVYTKNPIPKVKHKEALQILSNACRCTLSQSRLGVIQIRSKYMPKISVSSNDETAYSKVSNILTDTLKPEYASLAENYTKADGTMFFLPRRGKAVLETGYVSNQISDDDGRFASNPVVTFVMDNTRSYYGMKLVFGQSLPREFIIRTYAGTVKVNEFTIGKNEISKEIVISEEFEDCDKIQIEFTETAIPHNRITLNYFSLNDTVNFKMERDEMLSSPKSIKQELVKEIVVPCYIYQKDNTEASLFNNNVSAVSGKIETFYFQEPAYNYRVLLNDTAGRADIVEWGSYYIVIRYNVSGEYKLNIRGCKYKITERYAVKKLNDDGKTVKWKNPLVSDFEMAEKLAEWLGEYYSASVEYEYDTRGNPEMDSTDIIYQENEFVENMKVNVYRQTLAFNQAFSGKVTARRVGG